MPRKQAVKNPYNKALDILSRRDHSEHEMRQKLKKYGASSEEISAVVTALQYKKLLDDAQFAERYAESMLRQKPVGPLWITAKLLQKGIDRSLAEEVVSRCFPAGAEEKLAAKAARQWKQLHPAKADDKQRLARFLASRGFRSWMS